MNKPLNPFDCTVAAKSIRWHIEYHRKMAAAHPILYAEFSYFRGVLNAYEEALRLLEGRAFGEEKPA